MSFLVHPPQFVVISPPPNNKNNIMSSSSPESAVPSLAELSHISKEEEDDDSSFRHHEEEDDDNENLQHTNTVVDTEVVTCRSQLFPQEQKEEESELTESHKWTTMIADITLPFRPSRDDDDDDVDYVDYEEKGHDSVIQILGNNDDDDYSLDFHGRIIPRISSMIESSICVEDEDETEEAEDSSSIFVEPPPPLISLKQHLSGSIKALEGCSAIHTSSMLEECVTTPQDKQHHPFDESQIVNEEEEEEESKMDEHSHYSLYMEERGNMETTSLGLNEIHLTADSASVTKLQSEVESMKSFNHRLLSTITQLTSELKTSMSRNESLSRNNDELKDRECAHLDTIAILKNEVDRLTMSTTVLETKQQNVTQLQTENELFASQIIEYENEITKAKSCYESKEQHVAKLQHENTLYASQIIEYEHDLLKAKSLYESEKKVQENLQVELESMSSKIATMEQQKSLLTEQFGAKVVERDALVVHYRHKLERIETEIQSLRETVCKTTQAQQIKDEESSSDQVKMLSQLAELDQELEQYVQSLKQRDLELEELRGAIHRDIIETSETSENELAYSCDACGNLPFLLSLGAFDKKWF